MQEAGQLPQRLRIGVSACLLGEKVRYDGNHKLDCFVVNTLGRFFEFEAICPEAGSGLGIPRPPIRLVGDPEQPRAVAVDEPNIDVTEILDSFSRSQTTRLGQISGFILKSRSPSCGLASVEVQQARGRRRGSGLFALALKATHPLLPLIEEAQLADPVLRDSFLERVFAFRRWQELLIPGPTEEQLVAFHRAHKLILMAHSQIHYRALGRLVAEAGNRPLAELVACYGDGFMSALKRPATAKRHANVLQHLMGYLKRRLDGTDKVELMEAIEAYRQALTPRLMPMTLLRHHFRHHPDPYVESQLYLYPSRDELLLRYGGI